MADRRLSGTERSRRFRYRKRHGIAAVTVNVDLRKLIAAGLRENSSSKQKIAAAVEALVNTGTKRS